MHLKVQTKAPSNESALMLLLPASIFAAVCFVLPHRQKCHPERSGSRQRTAQSKDLRLLLPLPLLFLFVIPQGSASIFTAVYFVSPTHRRVILSEVVRISEPRSRRTCGCSCCCLSCLSSRRDLLLPLLLSVLYSPPNSNQHVISTRAKRSGEIPVFRLCPYHRPKAPTNPVTPKHP
jgi:hypothetical protein